MSLPANRAFVALAHAQHGRTQNAVVDVAGAWYCTRYYAWLPDYVFMQDPTFEQQVSELRTSVEGRKRDGWLIQPTAGGHA